MNFVTKEPINKGWSSDKKYCVTDENGTRYLLRVSDIAQHDTKQSEFNMMKQVASFGVPMCQPIEFGTCEDGVYSIQSWIDGEDAEQVMSGYSDTEQYVYGLEAGRILRKIHSIPAPATQEDWEIRFNRKMNYKIKKYVECPIKYENGQAFIDYINENRHLLKNRPQVYAHDHREVLLIFRCFLKQHEDDGLQECGFGFGPKRIRLMAALRRGGLDQVVDQLQHVLFVAQIAERIVTVRLFQIHKVQNAHVVALLFEIAARGKQHFRFGVCYDIIGVCGQDIRQHKTACFGCAAAADDQHVEGAAMLVRIQTETDVLGQWDAVLLRELRIDGCGCGPRRGAVFLAVAGSALIRPIKQNCHAISGKADEDRRQALSVHMIFVGCSSALVRFRSSSGSPPPRDCASRRASQTIGTIPIR